jgi:hypothetical protein
MVIYDFSAYLTTDLIQPGIIHIIREFEADVAYRQRKQQDSAKTDMRFQR